MALNAGRGGQRDFEVTAVGVRRRELHAHMLDGKVGAHAADGDGVAHTRGIIVRDGVVERVGHGGNGALCRHIGPTGSQAHRRLGVHQPEPELLVVRERPCAPACICLVDLDRRSRQNVFDVAPCQRRILGQHERDDPADEWSRGGGAAEPVPVVAGWGAGSVVSSSPHKVRRGDPATAAIGRGGDEQRGAGLAVKSLFRAVIQGAHRDHISAVGMAFEVTVVIFLPSISRSKGKDPAFAAPPARYRVCHSSENHRSNMDK